MSLTNRANRGQTLAVMSRKSCPRIASLAKYVSASPTMNSNAAMRKSNLAVGTLLAISQTCPIGCNPKPFFHGSKIMSRLSITLVFSEHLWIKVLTTWKFKGSLKRNLAYMYVWCTHVLTRELQSTVLQVCILMYSMIHTHCTFQSLTFSLKWGKISFTGRTHAHPINHKFKG